MTVLPCHTIKFSIDGGGTNAEKEVEQKLIKAVRKAGGFCIKFTSPGFDGVPDRLVLLPKGRMAFIELKAPGKKPRALQKRRIKQLSALGFPCYVVDNADVIGKILDEIGGDAE